MDLGVLAVVLLLVALLALASGAPVAIALMLAGTTAFLVGEGGAGLDFIANLPWRQSFSYELGALPLYVLMGFLLHEAGFIKHLFRAFAVWLTWMPGSLGIITLLCAGGFAAMSGSASATAATLGTVVRPEVQRYGYNQRLMLGILNAGADLAPIIPPSIALIIYGSLTQTSVSQLFAGGLVPGLIVLGLMIGYVTQLSIRKPELAPRFAPPTPGERVATVWVWPVASAIVLVSVGGILLGWYTPTEAAAIGSCFAAILLVAGKRFRWQDSIRSLWRAVRDATTTAAFIVLLMISGIIFSQTLTFFGFPQALSAFLVALDLEVWQLMALLTVILFLMGMFVDSLAMQVIIVPFLLPTLVLMDINLVWFGIYLVLMIEIGTNNPPFGIHLFVLQGVMGASYKDAVIGVIPFTAIWLVMVALVLFFPGMVTWLPGVIR